MNTTDKIASDVFRKLFTRDKINDVYEKQIAPKNYKGIDRIGSYKFNDRKEEQFNIILNKCLNGTYKFSPYLEKLQSKGRDRPPRVISIATMRDRIVLSLLKEYLHEIFSECVNHKLPNSYIREIKEFHDSATDTDLCFYKTDIKAFYDTIEQQTLLDILSARITSKPELILIKRAIRTPTVRINYRKDLQKEPKNIQGVPQGLAISNILANIYLHEADQLFESSSLLYMRYVDDILFVVKKSDEKDIKATVDAQMNKLNLKISETKSSFHPISTGVDYLGYHLALPIISVKQSTVERYLQSLAALFSSYSNNGAKMYPKVEEKVAKELFISDVNEKITGAISENRRYGWLFYFLELNDLPLLYKLDLIIRDKFCKRINSSDSNFSEHIKRLVTSFYRAKYSITDGYIHNYDVYDTTAKKIEYLQYRGEIRKDDEQTYSIEQIDMLFNRVKAKHLADLDLDVGSIS